MPSTGRSEEIKVTYGLCTLLQKLPEVESGLVVIKTTLEAEAGGKKLQVFLSYRLSRRWNSIYRY